MHHFCAEKLRFSNFKLERRECTSSITQVLYLKLRFCKPALGRSSRTTFVLKKRNFTAGAARRSSRTTFCTWKLRTSSRRCGALRASFVRKRCLRSRRCGRARRASHGASESASTRTISAEGLPSSRHIRTAPQRRALRHGRSLQRVRRAQAKFARRHSESASTRTISAEGSPSSRQIRTAPQRERFDTHDLRRGFAELKPNSHGATARALRHARSPQKVRRAQDKLARRHSESASTRTIFAEGSPSARHIRAAPQRERFDTHDLRRGFAELETQSHGATARALRHAQSPQRVRRAQDTFARRHSESASTRAISALFSFCWQGQQLGGAGCDAGCVF